jgi:hypothetical protein
MKTRVLFEMLGFQQDWEAITDQRPAYYYDFGNLRLTAAPDVAMLINPHTIAVSWFDLVENVAAG